MNLLHNTIVELFASLNPVPFDEMSSSWFFTSLLTVTFLVVSGALYGYASSNNLSSMVTSASTNIRASRGNKLPSIRQLVPAGGAQVWWGLFERGSNNPHKKDDAVSKKTTLRRVMTSIGRFSLKSQTERNPAIITFFVALSNEKGQKEIDRQEFGRLLHDRLMPKHERFRSQISASDDWFFEVVNDRSMDHYVTKIPHPVMHYWDFVDHIDEYVSSNLDVHQRLWEAQISTGPMGSSGAIRKELANQINDTYDRETVALFRVHHALCDGVSLSVAVGDICDESDQLHEEMMMMLRKKKERMNRMSTFQRVQVFFQQVMFYVVGSIIALSSQLWRSLLAEIKGNPFDQVLAVSKVPRCARSRAWKHIAAVDEVKQVAKTLSNRATINDLFVALATAAIRKQLEEHRTVMEADGIQKTLHIPSHLNITAPVHLQGGGLLPGQSLGNKIGAFVSTIPLDGFSAAQRLETVSRALLQGKTTPAPQIAWSIAKFASLFAPLSFSKWIVRHGHARSAAVISNVRGFPFRTHWNGRRVEFLSAFLPLPPGIPIGFVVQSYNGDVSFTVEADKRAVPDAIKFADWVLQEYGRMKAESGRVPGKKNK